VLNGLVFVQSYLVVTECGVIICAVDIKLIVSVWNYKPHFGICCSLITSCAHGDCRAVTDPRTGKRLALKKLLNVFQSLVSCTRVYRELLILCRLRHENVSAELTIGFCCTGLLHGRKTFITRTKRLIFKNWIKMFCNIIRMVN